MTSRERRVASSRSAPPGLDLRRVRATTVEQIRVVADRYLRSEALSMVALVFLKLR